MLTEALSTNVCRVRQGEPNLRTIIVRSHVSNVIGSCFSKGACKSVNLRATRSHIKDKTHTVVLLQQRPSQNPKVQRALRERLESRETVIRIHSVIQNVLRSSQRQNNVALQPESNRRHGVLLVTVNREGPVRRVVGSTNPVVDTVDRISRTQNARRPRVDDGVQCGCANALSVPADFEHSDFPVVRFDDVDPTAIF